MTERESTLLPLGKRVVRKLRAEGYADVEMEYAWLPLSEVVYGRQVSDWNVQGRVSVAAQELGLWKFGWGRANVWVTWVHRNG